MNRRQFLRHSVVYGASIALGNLSSCAKTPKASVDDRSLFKIMKIIDAHAHPDVHPDVYPSSTPDLREVDNTSTLKAMKELGMVASSFAAVGDLVFLTQGRLRDSEFKITMVQLEWWVNRLAKSAKVKLVLKASDVPNIIEPNDPPGAILAIEGGDPLEGNPDRVNEFYNFGVRMITLVHGRNNELGDLMRKWRGVDPGPMNNGLTSAGRKVVGRMQDLGMVIDVAHAHPTTLKQISEMSSRPLVDSHTSPCPNEDPTKCGRLRTWKDMELVAKTDGVVCTWPLAYQWGAVTRNTFRDWAKEILEMKKRLGMDHVGLGTDGGGHMPKLINGYRDIRDLVRLMSAMQDVGFSNNEIAAYMGGNFCRVLQRCIS